MSERRRNVTLLVPGVLHSLLFAASAFTAAPFVSGIGVGAAALAVLFGVVAGNLLPPGETLLPGIRFVGKSVLAAAIVLLGLRVPLADVLGLGAVAGAAAVGAVAGAVLVAMLFGRLLGVRAPLAACIGAGTGVCGVAAIAAVRAAVRADDEEVTYAVAAVTLLGSMGLLVYPVVQWLWHPLAAEDFGILSGSTLHSVPQAVGAAFAGGGIAAGAVATLVKLARVALLAPLTLALGAAFGQRDHRKLPRLPVEVWGFAALFAFGSLVAIPASARTAVASVDEVLLVVALAALGLQTRFSELRRAGARPLLLAVVAWLVLAVAVLSALRMLGGYGA